MLGSHGHGPAPEEGGTAGSAASLPLWCTSQGWYVSSLLRAWTSFSLAARRRGHPKILQGNGIRKGVTVSMPSGGTRGDGFAPSYTNTCTSVTMNPKVLGPGSEVTGVQMGCLISFFPDHSFNPNRLSPFSLVWENVSERFPTPRDGH